MTISRLFRHYRSFFLVSLAFLMTPSSYATESCGTLLLLPVKSESSVTVRLSLSSCEELANAAEVSFMIPPHLSFKNEDLLRGSLYKLPSDTAPGIMTLRFVSLDEMSGVNDLADLHFSKIAPGESLPEILPSSLILLSDGKGTNIFSMR